MNETSVARTNQQPDRRGLPSVRRLASILRDLPTNQRLILLQRWLVRSLRPGPGIVDRLPPKPRLLFLCHGNIMRSALAEALFRQLAGDDASLVASAGLEANDGAPADPRAVGVAATMGVDLREHTARRLNPEMVEQADLVVVMDLINEAKVIARFPSSADKVVLLGSFRADRGMMLEVRDPFLGSDDQVSLTFEQIRVLVESLALALRNRTC